MLLWFLETPYLPHKTRRRRVAIWQMIRVKKDIGVLPRPTPFHSALFETIPDQSIAKKTPHITILSPMSKGSLGSHQ